MSIQLHRWLKCKPCDVVWRHDFSPTCWVCGGSGDDTYAPTLTSQQNVLISDAINRRHGRPSLPDQIIRTTLDEEAS